MTYYNNQIILNLDLDGVILDVILNTYKEINIQVNQSMIHLFHKDSLPIYYESFSQAINNKFSLGFRIKLINNKTVFMFMIKHTNQITLFSVSLDEKMISLFDEIVVINNEQVQSIRNLYKKLSNLDDEYGFLEEIMVLNNTLINTRRELFQKNNQLNELNRQLSESNDTDYLTQLPNRRKFFKDLHQLTQDEYLLMMMDINNFKLVNDRYGHIQGDKLLISLGKELIDYTRKHGGYTYRLGGDEFSCIIPHKKDIEIQKALTAINSQIQKFDPNISLSYGYLAFKKDAIKSDRDIERAIATTDEMMYQMKRDFHKKNPIIPLTKK